MELYLLPILTFLTLVVVASNAAMPPEEYWNSVLPNTAMPKAITDLLVPSEFKDEKSTSVSVGKGEVYVGTRKPIKPTRRTDVGVGKGGVSVRTGKKKPVYVGVKPGANPFLYSYAATKTQLHDNPNVALFFLQNNLQPGSKFTLHFLKTSSSNPPTAFLARKIADSIPFSSKRLSQIFDHFNVKPGTLESETMENTIKECEAASIKGEEKYCATSMESMVDFSTSKLGKNVKAISTEVEIKDSTKTQSFTVLNGVKKVGSDKKAVVCHKEEYPYAVFYCHSTDRITTYEVPLEGVDDGIKVNAVAVCHADTSAWNPKHLAFQVLKVKPGTVPVCHFLPQDHVVWVSE